jgi:hypothetical protein
MALRITNKNEHAWFDLVSLDFEEGVANGNAVFIFHGTSSHETLMRICIRAVGAKIVKFINFTKGGTRYMQMFQTNIPRALFVDATDMRWNHREYDVVEDAQSDSDSESEPESDNDNPV